MTQSLKALVMAPFVNQEMGMMLTDPKQKDLIDLANLMQSGKVTPVIDRRYKLSDVPDAIRYLEEGHARGKVVISVQPEVAMESENIASIKPLVRVNLGVSILPLAAVAAEAKRGELSYLRLVDEPLTRDIGLVFHKSNYQPRPLLELVNLFKTARR